MDRNLIDYLPSVLKDVRELVAVMQSEQPQLSNLWQAFNDVFNDQYVSTATKNGVSRWEKVLVITPKATENLDARKFRILTKLNEQLPYTMRKLVEQIENLCGKDGYYINLKSSEHVLEIRVALTAKSNFESVKALLDRIVPASIVIDLTLKYNQHSTLAKIRHSKLANYNYNDLRNEVLI